MSEEQGNTSFLIKDLSLEVLQQQILEKCPVKHNFFYIGLPLSLFTALFFEFENVVITGNRTVKSQKKKKTYHSASAIRA